MINILSGLFVFSGLVGINYGLYKLGMWSVRKKLIDTRNKLLIQYPQDELLIEEISNHIAEIDIFNKSKKNNIFNK